MFRPDSASQPGWRWMSDDGHRTAFGHRPVRHPVAHTQTHSAGNDCDISFGRQLQEVTSERIAEQFLDELGSSETKLFCSRALNLWIPVVKELHRWRLHATHRCQRPRSMQAPATAQSLSDSNRSFSAARGIPAIAHPIGRAPRAYTQSNAGPRRVDSGAVPRDDRLHRSLVLRGWMRSRRHDHASHHADSCGLSDVSFRRCASTRRADSPHGDHDSVA